MKDYRQRQCLNYALLSQRRILIGSVNMRKSMSTLEKTLHYRLGFYISRRWIVIYPPSTNKSAFTASGLHYTLFEQLWHGIYSVKIHFMLHMFS